MINTVYINECFSTTKLPIPEKSVIKNKLKDKFESILFLPESEYRKGEGGLRTKGYSKKSYDDKPLISIITVVFNGEKHLEQTIKSVIEQSYDNIEYIIIDGGSIDSTLEIIKKHEEQIDYWVSEVDEGIYDAMNKGISLAKGYYIAFLNADDWYNIDTIKMVVSIINHNDIDYIFGNMQLIKDEERVGVKNANLQKYKQFTPIGHQALFVKLNVLQENPFSEKYKILADYDFMIKLIETEKKYIYLDKELVNFRMAGISETISYDKERFRLHYHYFGLINAIKSFLLETPKPVISDFMQMLIYVKNTYRNMLGNV